MSLIVIRFCGGLCSATLVVALDPGGLLQN